MSDAKLRDLQRRALAGDRDAEARLLGELVRLGRLTPERAQVAALVGHPTTAEALGVAVETPATLWAWVRAVAEADREAGHRALLAACGVVRPVWESENAGDGRFGVLEDACAEWIAGQRETHVLEVAVLDMPYPSPISYPPNRAARVVRALALSLLAEGEAPHLLDGLRYAHQTAPSELKAAITAAVGGWIQCKIRI